MLRAAVVVAIVLLVAFLVGYVVGGPPLLGLPALMWLAGLALGVNAIAFVPAFLARTERFYDLVGSLTSLALTAATVAIAAQHGTMSPVSVAAAVAVVLWAGRLGLFLFLRIRAHGKDGRFDAIKQSAPRFLIAWILQGLWVFLTTLSALTLVLLGPAVDGWGVAGFGLWALGYAVEVIADQQKTRFRRAHSGRFIDTGLWAWSRHPNYVGEITMWVGMFVAGVGTWSGGQWLTLLSPMFVVLLLTRISGVPLLESRADARWGDDPDYRAYKEKTPVLLFR
jgi:steroid 5-alpha reductase family enzyme